jgi:hypothetical protein
MWHVVDVIACDGWYQDRGKGPRRKANSLPRVEAGVKEFLKRIPSLAGIHGG